MSLDPVRRARSVTVVAALIGMLVVVVEAALAIDCTKARKPAELTICTSPEVRKCDQAMSKVYEDLRRSLAFEDFKTVRASQRVWISQRNATCGADRLCLLRQCQERIAALTGSSRSTRSEAQTAPRATERPLSQSTTSASEVPLLKSGGIYTVPVQINQAITLDFVVDSGAAEVNIPADVVMTLIRAKTITPSDFLPGAVYVLADGTRLESARFRIRTMRIGNRVVENASASIGEVASQLLLGQSVLERLGRWSLDTNRGVMVLGAPSGTEPSSVAAQQPEGSLPQQTVQRLPDGVPFPVGASRDEVRHRLGQPSFEKERGFWANTTVDRFDDVVPQWLTLSYLYDSRTLRVRQTEASFASWAGADALSEMIARMAGRSVGNDVRQALTAVGEQGARRAQFRVGSLEGTIERQDESRIFIAVWEPGTHRR
jgi:uncharacterized protein